MSNFWNGAGTYHIHFENEYVIGGIDETEFYAEKAEEIIDFWHDFCNVDGIEPDCLINIEFVCSECI